MSTRLDNNKSRLSKCLRRQRILYKIIIWVLGLMLVYLLLNKVNQKVYIGQTKHVNLSKRWNSLLTNVKVNNHLTNAIRKYGPASFQRKILCRASCQEELDLLERFWIAVYKATDARYGYNQQAGGRKWAGHYTPKLRQVLSEATQKAWANKSPKERWEFAFATKIRWLMRTERQRRRITSPMWNRERRYCRPWNKGLTGKATGAGRPSARKGQTYGPQAHPCRTKAPFTQEHKDRISRGLKRYHKERRRQEESTGRETRVERRTKRA